ncbi:hypothetical protein HOG98_06260 [bacterium]|jgi:hypothetical protein|nr:hypothetical protein [bacterium]
MKKIISRPSEHSIILTSKSSTVESDASEKINKIKNQAPNGFVKLQTIIGVIKNIEDADIRLNLISKEIEDSLTSELEPMYSCNYHSCLIKTAPQGQRKNDIILSEAFRLSKSDLEKHLIPKLIAQTICLAEDDESIISITLGFLLKIPKTHHFDEALGWEIYQLKKYLPEDLFKKAMFQFTIHNILEFVTSFKEEEVPPPGRDLLTINTLDEVADVFADKDSFYPNLINTTLLKPKLNDLHNCQHVKNFYIVRHRQLPNTYEDVHDKETYDKATFDKAKKFQTLISTIDIDGLTSIIYSYLRGFTF